MPFEKDPNELGCLWERQSARGPYMTGEINGVKVVVFKNTRKSSEKAPDWRVLKSQPREEKPARQSEPDADDIGF